jgi:hypothetical protein
MIRVPKGLCIKEPKKNDIKIFNICDYNHLLDIKLINQICIHKNKTIKNKKIKNKTIKNKSK